MTDIKCFGPYKPPNKPQFLIKIIPLKPRTFCNFAADAVFFPRDQFNSHVGPILSIPLCSQV